MRHVPLLMAGFVVGRGGDSPCDGGTRVYPPGSNRSLLPRTPEGPENTVAHLDALLEHGDKGLATVPTLAVWLSS